MQLISLTIHRICPVPHGCLFVATAVSSLPRRYTSGRCLNGQTTQCLHSRLSRVSTHELSKLLFTCQTVYFFYAITIIQALFLAARAYFLFTSNLEVVWALVPILFSVYLGVFAFLQICPGGTVRVRVPREDVPTDCSLWDTVRLPLSEGLGDLVVRCRHLPPAISSRVRDRPPAPLEGSISRLVSPRPCSLHV